MNDRDQSVVYEGWLTKSPPNHRLWRARWRRRWFSLRHSGELPDQYVLTYYADKHCRKLKGAIDLDQCEQVDLGLRLYEKKWKFDYVFDIKTPTRTYYLAADSENDMNTWVRYICRVCSLKCTGSSVDGNVQRPITEITDVEIVEEKSDDGVSENTNLNADNESPPISPVSPSPYIPISECFSGRSPILDAQDYKTLLDYNLRNSKHKPEQHTNDSYEFPQQNYMNYINGELDPRVYDCPRKLTLFIKNNDGEVSGNCEKDTQSPTDSESVFTDDDWNHNSSTELNSSRNTKPSDSSADIEVTQKFTKLGLEDGDNSGTGTLAPPRPPKPPHITTHFNFNLLTKSSTKSKENVDGSSSALSDDMYDFPRLHQVETESVQSTLQRRHNYNNAAPGCVEGHVFKYDISPKPSTSTSVFKYDMEDMQDEPASPASQGSASAMYSNLPSPLAPGCLVLVSPPIINRDLKPKRNRSDSMSTASNPEPSSPRLAPSIDRKLKPLTPSQTGSMRKTFESDEDRRARAAPSPTPPGHSRSHECLIDSNEPPEQIYHFFPDNKKMQYLDLDLDVDPKKFSQIDSNTLPLRSPGASTVYKSVDFKKTEAFNITRNNLEMERNKESIGAIGLFKK